jgi:hypothetical protein
MKASIVVPLLVVSSILLAGFLSPELSFVVTVQGVEDRDVLKDGLRQSEMTLLTINTNMEGVVVEKFGIMHARGTSPVTRATVRGNTFDLGDFRSLAKPGDRILITITSVVGPDKVSIIVRDVKFVIPIK